MTSCSQRTDKFEYLDIFIIHIVFMVDYKIIIKRWKDSVVTDLLVFSIYQNTQSLSHLAATIH